MPVYHFQSDVATTEPEKLKMPWRENQLFSKKVSYATFPGNILNVRQDTVIFRRQCNWFHEALLHELSWAF